MKATTSAKNNLKHYLVIGFGWNNLKGYNKQKTTQSINN